MRRAIILALLIIVGCGPLFQGGNVKPPPDISTGTDALQIDFTPTGSTNLLMCQQANVIVNLRNKGNTDIENGIFSLITEDQILGQTDKQQRQLILEGKSKFNPQGGVQQVQFKLKNRGLPPQLETYTSPAIFRACYEYETLAPIPICIDPDVRNTNPQKVCRSTVYTGGGQGAPVAVTKVEPVMVPDANTVVPTFTIYLQNMGNGRVVSTDSLLSSCTGKVTEKVESKAHVTVELQNEVLRCTPEDVNLAGGAEAKVVCSSSTNFGKDQGTFTTLLHVTVGYGYTNTATQTFTITRIAGQQDCSQTGRTQ